MESAPSNSTVGIAAVPSKRPSRRLLFDLRYGWVVDEWKHPSEEAFAGGRGMFCILPLAKSLWMMASKSIDFTSSYAVEIIRKPELLSPQTLQANLGTQLNRFKSSLLNPDFNPLSYNIPDLADRFPGVSDRSREIRPREAGVVLVADADVDSGREVPGAEQVVQPDGGGAEGGNGEGGISWTESGDCRSKHYDGEQKYCRRYCPTSFEPFGRCFAAGVGFHREKCGDGMDFFPFVYG